ncbi:DUF4129 domain-containing protein [Natronosalvus vescus]|uniref:DUF4129 domain-containing protein n=1 Tax=Natronosalvus vescus TaxID=2953881 RepID=UPI0020917658|nr:DUF4129 domain-containing protein [Natronosalvus vescus]
MAFTSDAVSRLLAVVAIGCAIGGILLASSAMPMVASDTPVAAAFQDEEAAEERERALQQAMLEAAGEDDPDAGDGDGGGFGNDDGGGFGDGDDLAGGAGQADGQLGADGALIDDELTQAAVLAAVDGQEEMFTDPLASEVLFGLAAIYASIGGSPGEMAGAGGDPSAVDPADFDGGLEDYNGDIPDDFEDGATEGTSGGLLDVPTSSSGLEGGYGDLVDDQQTQSELIEEAEMDGVETDADDATATDGSSWTDGDGSEWDDSGEPEWSDGFDDGDDDVPSDDRDWDDADGQSDGDDEWDDHDGEWDDGTDEPRDGSAEWEDGDSDGADHEETGSDVEDGDVGSESERDAASDDPTSDDDGDDGTDASSDRASDDGETNDERESDEGDGDDETEDDDEGSFLESLGDSVGTLGDRPLVSALLIGLILIVGYLFLTNDDPIAALRALPSRLVSVAMGAVVACSHLLERAYTKLAGVQSIAELPGLVRGAVISALASLRSKANSVRSTLPLVSTNESVNEEATIPDTDRATAREHIREAFDAVAALSTVYPLSVATPSDVATSAKAQGAPAEPVETITDAFRDVEYGNRDPARHVDETMAAQDSLATTLESDDESSVRRRMEDT